MSLEFSDEELRLIYVSLRKRRALEKRIKSMSVYLVDIDDMENVTNLETLLNNGANDVHEYYISVKNAIDIAEADKVFINNFNGLFKDLPETLTFLILYEAKDLIKSSTPGSILNS